MGEIDIYDPVNDGNRGDYVVQFRIKNGPLLRAIRLRGYKTTAAFIQATGLCATTVYRYLALRAPALRRDGSWAAGVETIAGCLRLPPETPFPTQDLERALAKNSGEAELSLDEVMLLSRDAGAD